MSGLTLDIGTLTVGLAAVGMMYSVFKWGMNRIDYESQVNDTKRRIHRNALDDYNAKGRIKQKEEEPEKGFEERLEEEATREYFKQKENKK